MTASILQFSGSVLTGIEADGDDVVLALAPARVVRSEGIPLSDASTAWRQDASLRIRDAEQEGDWPSLPAELGGGSIEARGYKTIGMIQLPMQEDGYTRLVLEFPDRPEVVLIGSGVFLEMLGDARYLRHLDD